MKLIIIGDIFGQVGKDTIKNTLSNIKNKYKPDVIIANGENVSIGGKSLIKEDYDFLVSCGINFITMGNHTFRNILINDYIDSVDNLVRPANYKDKVKGKGYIIFKFKNKKILLINLLGVIFMNIPVDNPFKIVDEILQKEDYDISIVDFHAEATSEKMVLGNYLKSKVNIFYGTHTHIQTSDIHLMDSMVYITDIGMTGARDSAIGANFTEVTNLMKDNIKSKFVEAKNGKKVFNAIFVELDDKNNKPLKYKSISKII